MLQPPQQPAQPQENDPNKDRNKQRGTGFTNINRVLGANVGAGQKMGQQIGSSLSGQAGQIKQGIQQGQAGFQAGMQQGAEGAQKAIAGGQALQRGADEDQEKYAARLAGVGQPQGSQPVDLAAQGQALRGAAYTGPQGLQNAGQLQSRAATASALGRLGATSAGQGQLLASQVAQRGNYGRGQGALDQMLLGRSGQQAIQKGRSDLSGVQSQAQGAVQGAQAQAGATGAAIDQSKVATQQALQNQLSGTGEAGAPKGFQQQAKEQAGQYNEQGTKVQQMLQGRNPDGTTIGAPGPDGKPIPSQYTEEDMGLLNDLDQFGLNSQQGVYGKNAGEYGNALNKFTQDIDTSQNARYTGNQGAAAGNLASFLGDTQAQKAAGQQFNDKLFSNVTNQSATQQNQDLQAQDVAKQGDINRNMTMQADLQTRIAALKAGKRNYGQQTDLSGINNVVNEMQAQGFDPNRAYGLLQGDLAANTGQSKSLKQLALEKMGKTYTPPAEEPPKKKLTQV